MDVSLQPSRPISFDDDDPLLLPESLRLA